MIWLNIILQKSGIVAVRRIKESDLTKLAKATGARIVTNLDDLFEKDLGKRRTGRRDEKLKKTNGFSLKAADTQNLLHYFLRGGSQRVVDEVERSVHDAIMVVKDVIVNPDNCCWRWCT